MKAKWENEKNAIAKVQKLREDIERTNADIEKAERTYDLNKAAELKYGELPKLQKELAAEEAIAEKNKDGQSLLRDKVTEEEIARIVARWTGIPVSKLMEGEREKLLHLEDVLHQRVIGQDEAVTKVCEAILRQPCGHSGSEQAVGFVPVLGPHGRWQDRAGQGAGTGAVRRREEHRAHRHVGVHGEVQRLPPDRRAAGLCGLRGGRSADGGGASASLFAWCCSTRWKRRIRTCSTCCCRCWTTAG